MTEWLKTNLFTLITSTVAIYGAILATLNYRHSRAEKKRRPKRFPFMTKPRRELRKELAQEELAD